LLNSLEKSSLTNSTLSLRGREDMPFFYSLLVGEEKN
jgi:hypothetical protein